jgi:eukaryotic-like serine/threonine-protein kinase
MRLGMDERVIGKPSPEPGPEVGAMETMVAASTGDDALDHPSSDEPGQREPPPALEVGALVGRYVVLSKLGAGGMGVVYAAYDPELDRKVALKLLLPGSRGEKGRSRLLREAQALGKLAHPHVVGIYDVGTVGEQVWLAMEFVRGETLGEWLQAPRRWREVLEVMVSAGEGLVAAHAAELLHRDFKPDNLMIGDDGRVRVMDFGLARTRREGEPSGSGEGAGSGAGAGKVAPARPMPKLEALATELTQAGTLLGTPSYMAPEQFSAASLTAAADQFAFCVTLWEALYGERPFAGDTMLALLANVVGGKRRPAPRDRKVPSRLRRACERGLSVEPEQRWPSMEALLDELRRLVVPRGRRRMVLVTAGLLALGGGLGTTQALVWLHRCTGARAQLEGAWDDVRRQEVKTAVLGTGLSHAPGTWERVEPRLDAYADAWAAEHTDACEATRSRGEQSEDDMSLRMGCLHERWLHLRATVDELSRADATVVDHAVQAIASLPRLERCRDLPALRADVPPPEEPAVAEQVAALDERLVEAKAKQEAGKYADGLRLADEVVENAAGLDYEPLMARAWLRQGRLRADLGEHEGAVSVLRKAYGAAVAHTMKAEAAEVSAELMYALGYRLGRYEDARGWAEHAEPLSRATGTGEARARYLNILGALAHRQEEYEDARDFFARALAISEKALGPDHPDVARSLNGLGVVAEAQGKEEDARDFLERALAITEKALGPDHPDVARWLYNLGRVAWQQAEYEEARKLFERALAIREKALGPDHTLVANLLEKLGNLAASQARYDEARDLHERALAITEKAREPDHPSVAASLTDLGAVLLGLGKPADAVLSLERALTICTTHEVDPASLAYTRFTLARALWDAPATQGRDRPRARILAEQAREAFAALGEGKKAELAEVEAWLAEHGLP